MGTSRHATCFAVLNHPWQHLCHYPVLQNISRTSALFNSVAPSSPLHPPPFQVIQELHGQDLLSSSEEEEAVELQTNFFEPATVHVDGGGPRGGGEEEGGESAGSEMSSETWVSSSSEEGDCGDRAPRIILHMHGAGEPPESRMIALRRDSLEDPGPAASVVRGAGSRPRAALPTIARPLAKMHAPSESTGLYGWESRSGPMIAPLQRFSTVGLRATLDNDRLTGTDGDTTATTGTATVVSLQRLAGLRAQVGELSTRAVVSIAGAYIVHERCVNAMGACVLTGSCSCRTHGSPHACRPARRQGSPRQASDDMPCARTESTTADMSKGASALACTRSFPRRSQVRRWTGGAQHAAGASAGGQQGGRQFHR